MISTNEVAKEAWDILRVHFEGTNAVHESRLELLTTKFENVRISEEETINDFNRKLCDIANKSFALREKIPEEKLVKKALRSLLPRFAYNATTIREAKDLKKMRLEESMGSLLTFKIELNKESQERKKLVGLRVESKLPVNEGNELSEYVALLSNNFERAIKRLNAQAKETLKLEILHLAHLILLSLVGHKDLQDQISGTSQSSAENVKVMVRSK